MVIPSAEFRGSARELRHESDTEKAGKLTEPIPRECFHSLTVKMYRRETVRRRRQFQNLRPIVGVTVGRRSLSGAAARIAAADRRSVTIRAGVAQWARAHAGRARAAVLGTQLQRRSRCGMVMAVVRNRQRAPLPTAHAARAFFGVLVDAAIAHASDSDFIAAARPVDVIEISRDGIIERQYASLDELKVPRTSQGATSARDFNCASGRHPRSKWLRLPGARTHRA
jgi:hypothetical protein